MGKQTSMVKYCKAIYKIFEMKRLTIISHTEHFTDENGQLVGWGSTITEINHLLEIFDEITHIAMYHIGIPSLSSLPYISERITFVALPTVGGPKLRDKLNILKNAPKIIRIINNELKHADYFQFRAPTGIGVFLIPYLTFFVKTKGWFKYAGNWNQKHPPLGYRLQRWLLKYQSRPVTINGSWSKQQKHFLTFENPCLTLEDIKEGQKIMNQKSFEGQLNFCFVGRLEHEKGVEILIDAFKSLSAIEKRRIGKIHLVGDGKEMDIFKQKTKDSGLTIVFHGFLPRNLVNKIYQDSHCFILPSYSEGFPKVITEAINFGCLPIVSDISSIGQYIKDGENGFLIHPITVNSLVCKLSQFIKLSNNDFKEMIANGRIQLARFSFDYYKNRVKNELIK